MDHLGKDCSIVLIGAGIMSATLGVLLKQLMPNCNITMVERMDRVAAESSDAWNNAGTGHSAFCELNYTPAMDDGSVDITKALAIAEQFEVSKQFWSFLVSDLKIVNKPEDFINNIDHLSFVWGEDNVDFLKKRYETMKQHALFSDMKYTEDPHHIKGWVPLIMDGRSRDEAIAATKMDIGTDVNFGNITRSMVQYLDGLDNVTVTLGFEVKDLKKFGNRWQIDIEERDGGKEETLEADFVFIGAGGGSFKLLEKSDIPQAHGYGGFPVSGNWLRCTNEKVIFDHYAKVYGKAEVGAPPMSVPHLDTRIINGKRALLFGPYAGFSTKFLKNGSYTDLFLSIEMHNVLPMLSAGYHNIPLTKYLIKQVVQSPEEKIAALHKFYPKAKPDEWETVEAGQRVQVIKQEKGKGGVLKFGTEVVCDEDGTIATLLGASPGASTSVSIMLDILSRCFSKQFKTQEWQKTLKEMIPSFGISLIHDRAMLHRVRKETGRVLNID